MTHPNDDLRAGAVRGERDRFLQHIAPFRDQLWSYCRRLAGNVWDAEDLFQESLMRAFARAPLLWQAENPRSYLYRICTNCWIDRRRAADPLDDFAPLSEDESTMTDLPAREGPTDPIELRDAFATAVGALAPRELAILLLKDVYGFEGEEIARMLQMSAGAARIALTRARRRLTAAATERPRAPHPASSPDERRLVDAFARAYGARDMVGVLALLSEHCRADIVGVAEEIGRETIARNSLADDFATMAARSIEVRQVDGRPALLVTEAGRLVQVLRLEIADGAVSCIRTYYFTPELLRELAGMVGLTASDHGFVFPPEGVTH